MLRIVKNFHLLENLSIKNNNEIYRKNSDNDIVHKDLNKKKDESIKIKLNPTIKSILSDDYSKYL